MKKIMLLALLFATTASFSSPAHAQTATQSDGTIFNVGTPTDTAKGNTTKRQSVSIGTPDRGTTIHYLCHHLTDTITGYASVWGSIDGITYAPYPGVDSVAIPAVGDVSKLWFINTVKDEVPVKNIEVRTRCVSNTTNATSKAKVTTKMYPYK